MSQNPRTKRRRNLEPGTARTRSQQVKVSQLDRELIVALAQLDGVTPSTWCYRAIMSTVEAQRHRIRNPALRLVGSAPPSPSSTPGDAPSSELACSEG